MVVWGRQARARNRFVMMREVPVVTRMRTPEGIRGANCWHETGTRHDLKCCEKVGRDRLLQAVIVAGPLD